MKFDGEIIPMGLINVFALRHKTTCLWGNSSYLSTGRAIRFATRFSTIWTVHYDKFINYLVTMAASSTMKEIECLEEILEKHLPPDELSEVKRILSSFKRRVPNKPQVEIYFVSELSRRKFFWVSNNEKIRKSAR